MVQFDLVAVGLYFILTAIWWIVQVTKKYFTCVHKHVEFHSSASFACVGSARFPIEGLVKLSVGLIAAIGEFFLAAKADNDDRTLDSVWRTLLSARNATDLPLDLMENGPVTNNLFLPAVGDHFLSHSELGTVFIFFAMAGLVDLMAGWSTETSLWFGQGGGTRGLDYVTLALFFLGEAAVFFGHTLVLHKPLAATYTLTMMVCLAAAAATALELYCPTQVLCPLFRGHLVLTQGSWFVHVALMMDSAIFPRNDPEDILLISMFFSWHFGVNFVILLIVWLVVHKLMAQNLCCCASSIVPSGTDVYLENRVRFDYRILDRLDSDVE